MPAPRTRSVALALLLAAPLSLAADASRPEPLPTIEDKTAGMEKRDGFLPVYWDAKQGKLWLEISRLGTEILYYTSLPAGIGSNDIGLDRGQVGPQRIVRFERVGPKVLLVQSNENYRADTDDPKQRRAVEESFATSVLFGFEVAAESGSRVLVDATPFFLADGHDVRGQLERTEQGAYALDATRSAPWLPRTAAFPKNTEVEVTLTFTTTGKPGAFLASVTPTPTVVSVREHYSFVELPDGGYRRRINDPRAGYYAIAYADYAAPLGSPLTKSFLLRHRLEKRDPTAKTSDAVEPIVYYLDPAAPEPVRSAILDGARWWSGAFEKAGYRNAFRVEMLPDGADPMDVRYNMIEWVHRATRGWSYGSAVIDPRTGEILKGHVLLGSLRVRQDFLLAEGLLAPYTVGDEDAGEASKMALARIRQLAAHEVGHSLGLQHNFLASTEGPEGRASVMDYPHPLTKLRADGTIDLADAYAVGVGAWDEVAIAYGYQDFPKGTDERQALEKILRDAWARGLVFLTDQDARPFGSAHPGASLWDNGTDATAELDRVMSVRKAALARFGERAIRNDMPLATMEEALVPLFLHHRYQTTAAAKAIGGTRYSYAFRGDGQEALTPVPGPEQEKALEAVLRTIRPEALTVPRAVLDRLPPRPDGYPSHRELFARRTGIVFDPLAPADAAAAITMSALLDPDRVSRLLTQSALDPSLPGLAKVLGRLTAASFGAETRSSSYEAEVNRVVEARIVGGIERIATSASIPQSRAVARSVLEDLKASLEKDPRPAQASERASRRYFASRIARFLDGKETGDPLPPSAPPPGEPIGDPLGCEGD